MVIIQWFDSYMVKVPERRSTPGGAPCPYSPRPRLTIESRPDLP